MKKKPENPLLFDNFTECIKNSIWVFFSLCYLQAKNETLYIMLLFNQQSSDISHASIATQSCYVVK